MMNKAKYHSKKVTRDGITFDSAKECRRYFELLQMAESGEIQNLERQVKFELMPSQYAAVFENGKIKNKCVERPVTYVADFVYIRDGLKVVEDTKGFRTKDYIIKRKLMLLMHGIRIQEI